MTLQLFENPAPTAHGCRLVMYHKYLPLGVLNLPPHISQPKRGGGEGGGNQSTKTALKEIVLFYCNYSQRVCKLYSFFSSFLRGAAPLVSCYQCSTAKIGLL